MVITLTCKYREPGMAGEMTSLPNTAAMQTTQMKTKEPYFLDLVHTPTEKTEDTTPLRMSHRRWN
jgi:hypothetical protein